MTICGGCGYHYAAATPRRPATPTSSPIQLPPPADRTPPDDAKPLLQLVKPLILILLGIVTVLMLFWPTIAGWGGPSDKDMERAMRDWLHTRNDPRPCEVRVEDAVAKINFTAVLPIADAVAIAGDAAVFISKFARSQGWNDLTFVEVSYLGNELAVAKAVKGALLRTRSVTVIPVELMVPVPKPAKPHRLLQPGYILIILVWTLLAVFAVMVWRMVR
jgi:hypothetical protein